MASVRKLKPDDPKSPWICEYTDVAGKRRRITPKTGLKKDAETARRRIEAELEQGTHKPDAETVTLEFAIRAWLADCQRRWEIGDRMAGTTFHKYRSGAYIHVIPSIGNLRVTKTSRAEIQAFIDTKARTLKWNTLSNLAIVIKQSFKFAIEKDWIYLNPLASKPLRLPYKRKVEKPIPNKDEIRRILSAVLVRAKHEARVTQQNRIAVVTLALFSGLRSGEVCGLQWENVDLANGCLNIRHSLSKYDGLKGPKTDAGIRRVDLAPPVLAMLRELKAAAGPDATGYVLRGTRGRPVPPKDMWCQWHPILKKAGLLTEDGKNRYTFHALRHTAVSLLIEQGLQPFHIKSMIGHSSIMITMDLYGHMFPDDGTNRKAITAAAGQFEDLENMPIAAPVSSRRIVPGPTAPIAVPPPMRRERDMPL